MKITECNFKNVKGVCLETKKVRAIILPEYGARIQSLVRLSDGKELLCQDPNPEFIPQTRDGEYCKSEVSGIDDMFPTIDPIVWQGGARDGLTYPDHGIVSRVAHEAFSEDGETLTTLFTDLEFGFTYEKNFYEKEGKLCVSYKIRNYKADDFHIYFALHFMIAGEKGAKTITPYKKDAIAGLSFDKAGEFGERFSEFFPDDKALTQRPFSDTANAYKFFYKDPIPEGYVAYKYTDDTEFRLEFDKEKLPFVGIWVNNGRFKGLYNTAIEVATGPFDSPTEAIKRGVDTVIPGGDTMEFELKFVV